MSRPCPSPLILPLPCLVKSHRRELSSDDHRDDGLMLISSFQVSKLGLKPLARIVGYGDAAVEPVDWPVAPALGVQQMLQRYFV